MRLLVAAFPPELGAILASPPEGWASLCAGVGAVSAAASLSRHLALEPAERVLFVGTCGTYDPHRAPIGTLAAASEVVAGSLGEQAGAAARPDLECVRWEAGFLPPLPPFSVVGVPAITTTEEGARSLTGLGMLEHLELPGIFEACRMAGVPCGAALAVANEVGPQAREQWQARHAELSGKLVETLLELGVFR